MAAAIRLSRRHKGLTGTNPSVATLIVRDDGNGPRIVGRGVTEKGGRPHAETVALAEAGELARGATAYVTLEPCAHHGRTAPCADALVASGIARLVGAADDPDPRVAGRGYAILRRAGVVVETSLLAGQAADIMAGYLSRSIRKRPEVVVKLALSADNMIGQRGKGQIAITGAEARRQVHVMRMEADAIIVGLGTVIEDDPLLTVRLPGLEQRSPDRIILDCRAMTPLASALVRSARDVPVFVVAGQEADQHRRNALAAAGVGFLACDRINGGIALPELLEDLAGRGMSSVMVEGGADTVRAFLDNDLVDRIVLFRGTGTIGSAGIVSPLHPGNIPAGFTLLREGQAGKDRYAEWTRRS